MINKIEILLESIGYVGPSNSGEKVVELIEEAGMLPPDNGTQDNDEWEYQWELEDE